jgi:hypothetical protein
MNSTVEIPAEVQSLVATVIARGRFSNEQELVSEILKVAVPALDDYDQMRRDVAEQGLDERRRLFYWGCSPDGVAQNCLARGRVSSVDGCGLMTNCQRTI